MTSSFPKPQIPYPTARWGHADDPPLLLIHGFTGRGDGWADLAVLLADAGYRVIAPDLPGHGDNLPGDVREYGMERAAQALADLIDREGAGPAHLLGYSMGGRLALYFALAFPEKVRSLVLESASPGLATEAERVARQASDGALAARIEAEGIPAFVTFWESLTLWQSQVRLTEDVRQGLRQNRLQNNASSLAHSLRGMGTGVQPSLWARLPGLTIPTLLLAGAEDAKFAAINRQMAGAMPTARLVVVPEAGHTIHLEQPERFAAELLAFLHMIEESA